VNNLHNCRNCGQPVESGDKFCRNCGFPFEERLTDSERFSEPPPITPHPPEPPRPPIPPAPPSFESVPPPPPPEEKYVAWEDREKHGFFTALWETWKESISNPDRFFSRLPYSGGMGSPLLYAVLIGWFYYFVESIYSWIFSGIWGSLLSRYVDSNEVLARLAVSNGVNFIWLVLAPIFIIIGLFVLSGIYHVIGMIFGWAKRDFEATLRALAYSAGPLVFAIVPFCGSPIAAVWSLVLMIIGYKHMQQTTGGKATITILLPLILCCCLIFILSLIFGAALIAMLQGAASRWDNY